MVRTAYEMYKDDFRWKDPPYEYVYDRNPLDVISGTTRTREAIEKGTSLTEIRDEWQPALEQFRTVRAEYLLY